MNERLLYVCTNCAEQAPDTCGHFDRNELRVVGDAWLCDSCFADDPSIKGAWADYRAPLSGSDVLWCCHVRGPDEVHPAPDYATALKWADAANALNWRGHTPDSYDDCLLKAVPAIWPWRAETHAAMLAKSIHDNTPRNALPPDDPDYRSG